MNSGAMPRIWFDESDSGEFREPERNGLKVHEHRKSPLAGRQSEFLFAPDFFVLIAVPITRIETVVRAAVEFNVCRSHNMER